MIKKIAYLGVIGVLISSVISCEKDFTDIGTNIIKNNDFSVSKDTIDISIDPKNIESVIADNITANPNLYWLGVYNNSDYKKIEASIISQLGYLSNAKIVDKTYGTDTIVETKMDEAFLRLPYIATKSGTESDGKPIFRIDSLIGNASTPTILKVYQNETFLNNLDPLNTSKSNIYKSNKTYTSGSLLNKNIDFKFTIPQDPKTKDTIYVIERNLSTGKSFKDTLKIANSAPFMAVPLNKELIKSKLLDKFDDSEFANKVNFANYFKGLIIEASGDNGVLAPFTFSGASAPTLEVYYTNTILKGGKVIDTITKNISFPLRGITNSKYVTAPNSGSTSISFPVQGTAGSYGEINILNNVKIQELKDKDLLINDASLVFYIDQSKDTSNVPNQLFLYRKSLNTAIYGLQTPDLLVDGPDVFGGKLVLENNKKDHYKFRITQYISDILDGSKEYTPLHLSVYNTTNTPTSAIDTIVTNRNWNPRAVWLSNENTANSVRKAELRISYTQKNN